jgi:hypothetical protein
VEFKKKETSSGKDIPGMLYINEETIAQAPHTSLEILQREESRLSEKEKLQYICTLDYTNTPG